MRLAKTHKIIYGVEFGLLLLSAVPTVRNLNSLRVHNAHALLVGTDESDENRKQFAFPKENSKSDQTRERKAICNQQRRLNDCTYRSK